MATSATIDLLAPGGRAGTLARAGEPGRGAPEPPALRVLVFDPPSVELHGEAVHFPTRHAELAVYLLALTSPKGVTCGDMGRWLWPSAPRHRRNPRLRTLLWQIRNALGDQAWRLQRDGVYITFDVAGVEIDCITDEELAAAAAEAEAEARAAAAAAPPPPVVVPPPIIAVPLLPEGMGAPPEPEPEPQPEPQPTPGGDALSPAVRTVLERLRTGRRPPRRGWASSCR